MFVDLAIYASMYDVFCTCRSIAQAQALPGTSTSVYVRNVVALRHRGDDRRVSSSLEPIEAGLDGKCK